MKERPRGSDTTLFGRKRGSVILRLCQKGDDSIKITLELSIKLIEM